ncbi:hypothetical protein SRABI05_03675 [Agrobacterium fabrum]|nr:hypothetical protein SRABI46_03797 [Agrobacterium fabrum]CAH0276963.1 hypothetical protein SRABI05_03675 [Agrobacterium fabrum]
MTNRVKAPAIRGIALDRNGNLWPTGKTRKPCFRSTKAVETASPTPIDDDDNFRAAPVLQHTPLHVGKAGLLQHGCARSRRSFSFVTFFRRSRVRPSLQIRSRPKLVTPTQIIKTRATIRTRGWNDRFCKKTCLQLEDDKRPKLSVSFPGVRSLIARSRQHPGIGKSSPGKPTQRASRSSRQFS